MFERVGAKKTEKGVAVFMRAYGISVQLLQSEHSVVSAHVNLDFVASQRMNVDGHLCGICPR
jgi:hypothetical protein